MTNDERPVRAPAFFYRRSAEAETLYCERIPLAQLAERHGTPLYVYSATAIRQRFRAFDAAFRGAPHTVCYSVKANPNLGLLRLLAKLGAGFDVVSGGELLRVKKAAPRAVQQVVFSGVGKTADEMDLALRAGILLFNVESAGELELLAERAARLKRTAWVALRVNPDVPAETHPYISTGLREHKFGVAMPDARQLYRRAAASKWLHIAGVSAHIGSQITSVAPFAAAMARVAELVRELAQDGHRIRYVDAGGGLGIPYDGAPSDYREIFAAYARAVREPLAGLNVHLLLEPGRSIVGPAGALVTRVLYLKANGAKRFVVVDAGMNDLLRPSLYGAQHEIVPVEAASTARITADVVGPVCETGDFLARDRELTTTSPDELLAVLDAGAYGMSLASNYNTRPRAAEVLVEGKKATVIRRRETFADLVQAER
jgi:diaminopimelate decarboxylase